MKVSLELHFLNEDASVTSAEKLLNDNALLEDFDDIRYVEGRIQASFDDDKIEVDYEEPILRLVNQWVRRVPWIIGGDTESIAFRNTEECYGFVPLGDTVELSLFEGSESEVESYLIEPHTVRLADFVATSIEMGETMLKVVKAVDASLLESDEDCKELVSDLEEARRAWKEFEMHGRR
tara:strand:- start:47 stop:583 length:537 start_codon:yes stop_codon:yes gene_type:complete